ncbi:MAG: histidine phosphatase family protein [Bacteroidales bacterium]|nr:histidine phosphatase family protein [Bacteroidales bacterium]
MKKLLFVLTAFLGLAAASALAQVHQSAAAVQALQEDRTRAGNNLNSYEFFPIKDTKAPAGYKPFYVSHYGRHGSRSDWGGNAFLGVIAVMEQGQARGILTPDGEMLLEGARKVLAGWDGMDGRLSQRGVREHAAIAKRLYNRYPQVFKGQKDVRAFASTVQRCIISMNSFTNSLIRQNPKLEIRLDTGEKFMEYLDNEKGWQQKTGKAMRKSFEYMRDIPDDSLGVLSKVFTNPVAAREIVKSARHFTDDVFNTARVAEDFDIEEDIYSVLPFDAVYRRWAQNNMFLYLGHCNSVDSGAERVPMAESLVADIVTKADEAIAGGKYCADLRFGHDYPLMALVSYLGIEGVGDRLEVEEICDKWLGFWNIPMASNLQMIFYKNKAGDVLVKFLYQEQEKLLRGLEPYQGPYYKWETVKANLEGYKR